MDPQALYDNIINSLYSGEYDTDGDFWCDLHHLIGWIDRGGFRPKVSPVGDRFAVAAGYSRALDYVWSFETTSRQLAKIRYSPGLSDREFIEGESIPNEDNQKAYHAFVNAIVSRA